MPRWICYYHFVWSTKNREALITPKIESVIHATIKRKSDELDCPTLAINGIEDHLHVAVMVTPRIAAAEWVRVVKGASAHEVNRLYPNEPAYFRWQGSYSVQTFGQKNLSFVLDYIHNQKQHHAAGSFIPYLEATAEEE